MIVISENALMMSIQAIHHLLSGLTQERDETSDASQADYDEMIEAYTIAAMELREVYEKERLEDSVLPSYDDLISSLSGES